MSPSSSCSTFQSSTGKLRKPSLPSQCLSSALPETTLANDPCATTSTDQSSVLILLHPAEGHVVMPVTHHFLFLEILSSLGFWDMLSPGFPPAHRLLLLRLLGWLLLISQLPHWGALGSACLHSFPGGSHPVAWF